jgi:hypothetical protein
MDTFGVTLTKLKRLCHRPNPSASYYFGLRRVLAPIGDLNPNLLNYLTVQKWLKWVRKLADFMEVGATAVFTKYTEMNLCLTEKP